MAHLAFALPAGFPRLWPEAEARSGGAAGPEGHILQVFWVQECRGLGLRV